MRYSFAILILGAALFTICSAEYNARDVIVKDRRLYVDGKEFFVKGMAYNPVPLGYQSMDADGWGGGGFCSPKRTVFNEWKSACHDSDFADGGVDPTRFPASPAGGWWAPVWERDFPIMKSLGVNTVRIYNVNPSSATYVREFGSSDPDIQVKNYGPQHRPFLDMAYKYGMKVIFPILSDEATFTNNPTDKVENWIRSQIIDVGDHPALLMWAMGNELNFKKNPGMLEFINKHLGMIRNITLELHNRVVPVTSAVVDDPEIYDVLVPELDVDIFTTNAGYRGPEGFGTLWEGDPLLGFSGFMNLTAAHNKPLLIGEQGFPADKDVNYVYPNWFNKQWKDLMVHVDSSSVIGSVFFEYNDEPYKGCSNCTEQHYMGVVNFTVWYGNDGSSSMDENVFKPDVVTPKDNIFASLMNGTYLNKPYNMNANVWSLIGRAQTVLSDWNPAPLAEPPLHDFDPPVPYVLPPSKYNQVNNSASMASFSVIFILISLIVLLM
eukprot:TRINITY_DN8120_c0_g1_i1.p1 TRINITY_DN8120_c0_g1~~TRINITY_DN8120_c0_g1_i1.p1  ORF type:complete len:493 (-),score=131.66 TRINITY_DN8120_c0_g1_i1:54-1532(-)